MASDYIESVEGISDLQARAYAKTGLTENNIEPLLDYMIRLQLSDIKHFKDESYGEGLGETHPDYLKKCETPRRCERIR